MHLTPHAAVFWLLSILAAAAPGPGSGGVDDWPQWRGPGFDGSSSAVGLPASIGPDQGVVWKTELPGQGAATPVCAGGRVFLTALRTSDKALQALAVDQASGELLWSQDCGTGKLPSPRSRGRENTLAACSPVTDGKLVGFLFGTGRLLVTDVDGQELWSKDLVEDYGELVINWGYAASPLLLGDALVVPLLRRGESLVVAFEASTGETLWEVLRENEARAESQESYATPIPFENQGRTDILIYGGDCLTGHDPVTGEERWRWEGVNPQRRPNFRAVSSAVVGEDGMVFVTTPQHGPMHALRVTGTKVEKVWQHDAPTPDSTTPLYYRGRLYAVDGRRSRMVCLEPASGREVWSAKLDTESFLRASPTGADGKIYLLDAEGTALVLAAGDAFELLHRASFDSYPSRSSIVTAGGKLFVRTAEHLYCLGTTEPKDADK